MNNNVKVSIVTLGAHFTQRFKIILKKMNTYYSIRYERKDSKPNNNKTKKNCKNIGTWKKLAYKEIRQKNEENNEAKYKCVWLESSLFKVKGIFFC